MVTRSPGRGPGQQRPEPQTRTRSQARVNLHAHYMFCTRVLHDYMALWQGRRTLRVLPLFPGMFRLNLQCQQQSTTIRCTEFR